MNAKVMLDKAGRVVLPKRIREALDLSPGDTLELSMDGEDVVPRPQRSAPRLQIKRAVWVFRTREPLAADETRDTIRTIRERQLRRNAEVAQ